jgi:hypothetical protein
MDRFLTIAVFIVVQAAALVAAASCYGPACEWMTGGNCLSPAVRVPLVVLGVVVAEALVLAAIAPCNRLTHRLWGRPC